MTTQWTGELGLLNEVRKFEVRFINSNLNSVFWHSLFDLSVLQGRAFNKLHNCIVLISNAWLRALHRRPAR